VDRALASCLEHATLAEHNLFDGPVVREHGDDRVTLAGVCQLSSQMRAPIDQLLRLARRAIVDGDLVAGPEQVRRHPDPHVPEPDESDLHDLTSRWPESVTVRLVSDLSTEARVRAELLQLDLEREPERGLVVEESIVAVERLWPERADVRRLAGGLRADHHAARAEVTLELRPEPSARRGGVRRGSQHPQHNQSAHP